MFDTVFYFVLNMSAYCFVIAALLTALDSGVLSSRYPIYLADKLEPAQFHRRVG